MCIAVYTRAHVYTCVCLCGAYFTITNVCCLVLGPTDRVVRVRDRRGQELAGDGAEKEFPRAWGLLHETMKTKFGIDKLDFSTTTLQLAGHDYVIHRCMVKIYKPRNFQATGEGYSSRVAESRCAAMACITLRV